VSPLLQEIVSNVLEKIVPNRCFYAPFRLIPDGAFPLLVNEVWIRHFRTLKQIKKENGKLSTSFLLFFFKKRAGDVEKKEKRAILKDVFVCAGVLCLRAGLIN